MAWEIERKFLIGQVPRDTAACLHITQAYLQADPARSVRLRITTQADRAPRAEIAVKGPAAEGHFSRQEFQYAIPVEDAQAMMAFCDHLPITKRRYHYRFAQRLWELDEFLDANDGLLLAEIELRQEQELVELPPFITAEVTGDPRYFNLTLAYHPFTTWQHEGEAQA